MIPALFSKLFLLVTLLMMVLLFQVSKAQFGEGFEGDVIQFEPIQDCPAESLVHYKNRRGSVDECSTCIGIAERKCEEELKKQKKDHSICFDCTTKAAGSCDSLKFMCYNHQECGGPNYRCIAHECVLQAPSK